MKKLCAKQNWRAKQWEFSQTVRNVLRISQCEISQCEKPQRISQCEKPFGNAKIHLAMRKTIWQCENPFGNAKIHLAMRKTIWQCEKPFGNAKIHLAMRKSIWQFRNAKFRNAKTTLQISQCEKKISQCQMVANCLRKFMFFFFSSDFQYMLQNLHKTSKIKAIKIA